VAAGVDTDPSCRFAFEANNAGAQFFCKSVDALSGSEIQAWYPTGRYTSFDRVRSVSAVLEICLSLCWGSGREALITRRAMGTVGILRKARRGGKTRDRHGRKCPTTRLAETSRI